MPGPFGDSGPSWGDTISGLAAVGGAAGSYFGAREQNRGNSREAALDRQFQERMSGTAYQRAVADMKLAGINPMLAYMQGGASSPGGAHATMQDAIGPAVSSAKHGLMLGRELKLMDAQIAKTQSEKVRTDNEARLTATRNWNEGAGDATGPDAGNSYEVMRRRLILQQLRTGMSATEASAALDRAGLPAAIFEGSRKAAIARMIMMGANSAVGVYRAIKK